MLKKELQKLLADAIRAEAAREDDIEPLPDQEAEELSGGSVNAACPNTMCDESCVPYPAPR